MGKLVVTNWLSVDGVLQAPGLPDEDRDGGFQHGGWVGPHFDPEMGKTIIEQVARADTVLLGRKTYEIFAAYWPHVTDKDEDDPVASKLNAVPKLVVSTSLQEPLEWQNATLVKGDVVEEISKLREHGGDETHVVGSAQLVQTLLRHDLIDEYVLWVFPLLLGRGKRLFDDGTIPTSLKHVDTTTSSTGVTINTYERVGKLEPVSIGPP